MQGKTKGSIDINRKFSDSYTMHSNNFRFKQSTLHFTIMGHGPQPLLLFHGFGQDHSSFLTLSSDLSEHYTAYIFDLYFHGKSHWAHDEQPLEKTHWKETIDAFLLEHDITTFCLAAYSLGGKLALATVEAFPERVRGIILLAPDGIKTSFWYKLATSTSATRRLFKSMINRPERFHRIVALLNKMKLADPSLLKFATFQMNTIEKRSRVYYSWIVFRRLHFDISGIASTINKHQIPCILVVGQHDKVVSPGDVLHLARLIPSCKFEMPPTGHTGLIGASGKYFKDLLTLLSR